MRVGKISKRGLIFKSWVGGLSQGVSNKQQFNFSVLKKDKDVLEKLKDFLGKKVKLTYKERFGTFTWMGPLNIMLQK